MSEQLFKFAERRYTTVLENLYIQEAMCVYLPKFQQLKVKSTDRLLLHEIDRDVFSKVSFYSLIYRVAGFSSPGIVISGTSMLEV